MLGRAQVPLEGPVRPTLRLLVVEDDPHLRRAVVRILRRWGYEIIEAADGRSALERLCSRRETFDLVLLDIMLPEVDGLQVAQTVRAERPELAIVACSAAFNDELLDALNAVGVAQTLPKPYSADCLRQTVEDIARRA